MFTPLATIAAPPGILAAIDLHAAQRGVSHSELLAKAGLVQADWDAIATALGGVNAANFRKLLNASYTTVLCVIAPVTIQEGANGLASSASFNAPVASASRFGDLS